MHQANASAIPAPLANGTPPLASSAVSTPVIELRGLSVRLGEREVLRDLTCSFSGRVIGLLGPNGAGKSTLISTLLGFWTPSAGSAHIFGSDIRLEAKKLRSLIGYMPENDAFISGMTAVAFIRLMAELSGLPPEAALERAHEALFYVGLGEARYRKLGTYSLGMKQMAKLAQAIAHGPKLVILDEPTNGVDPISRREFWELLYRLADENILIILTTAYMDEAERCAEVHLMEQGHVVVEGEPRSLLEKEQVRTFDELFLKRAHELESLT